MREKTLMLSNYWNRSLMPVSGMEVSAVWRLVFSIQWPPCRFPLWVTASATNTACSNSPSRTAAHELPDNWLSARSGKSHVLAKP